MKIKRVWISSDRLLCITPSCDISVPRPQRSQLANDVIESIRFKRFEQRLHDIYIDDRKVKQSFTACCRVRHRSPNNRRTFGMKTQVVAGDQRINMSAFAKFTIQATDFSEI